MPVWAGPELSVQSEDKEHRLGAGVSLGPVATAVNKTDHACFLPLWKETDTDKREPIRGDEYKEVQERDCRDGCVLVDI